MSPVSSHPSGVMTFPVSSGRRHDTIRQRDGRRGSTVHGERGHLLPLRRQWTSGLSVKLAGLRVLESAP